MNALKLLWPAIVAMIVVVVSSNIAVQYPINAWLTWGAMTYPISFLVTDLTNRRFGPQSARTVVYIGFAVAVVLSVYFAGWRIAMASGSAFLFAQLLDVSVFNRMRRMDWWRAPLVSSVLASVLDTAMFFSLAFAGTGLPWVTWAVGDFGAKLAMALTLLVPFRLLMQVIAARAPNGLANRAGTS